MMGLNNIVTGALAVVAGASLIGNVLLVAKVNSLKERRAQEKKTARMTIKSILKATTKLEEAATRLENTVESLNKQLDMAADVVYKFQEQNRKLKEELEAEAYAAADVQNKLRKFLYSGRIIKKVWSDNLIETYDPNRMTVKELAEMLGHPINTNDEI